MSADGLERARHALAQAKADAAARGARPVSGGSAESRVRADDTAPGNGGRPDEPERLRGAARQHRDDPQPLSSAIDGLLADHGWHQRAAIGGAFGRWAQIVGTDLAAHAWPESLTDGELLVVADSTAWATQLRLLAGDLVRRLNSELGDATVRRVRVSGPGGDRAQRRGWRVRGGRGPRDTYG